MARKKKTTAKTAVNFDAPQSRNEALLMNILGANNVLEAPQSRNEAILQVILNGTSYTEEPQSRIEELLLCILNGTTTDMVPQSRNEEILIAKINGGSYDKAPQSRIEELLIQWLNAAPAYIEKTVTGNPISIADAIAAEALALSVAIEPIQEGSGDPSPENIRPVTGHDSVSVVRTGKNLLNPEYFRRFSNIYDINEDGTLTVKLSDGNAWTAVPVITLPAGTYTLSYIATSGNVRMRTSEDNYATEITISTTRTFTFGADVGIKLKVGVTGTYPLVCKIQIESGSTATTYEPYQSVTVTVPFEDTVYGGTLDMANGVLTMDRAMMVVTDCYEVGIASTGIPYLRTTIAVLAKAESSNNKNISSEYRYRTNAPSDSGWFRVVSQNILFVFDSRFTDLSIANSILASEKPQFVVELAAPITLTLTPQELALLQGDNVITSDGEITLTYKAQS